MGLNTPRTSVYSASMVYAGIAVVIPILPIAILLEDVQYDRGQCFNYQEIYNNKVNIERTKSVAL